MPRNGATSGEASEWTADTKPLDRRAPSARSRTSSPTIDTTATYTAVSTLRMTEATDRCATTRVSAYESTAGSSVTTRRTMGPLPRWPVPRTCGRTRDRHRDMPEHAPGQTTYPQKNHGRRRVLRPRQDGDRQVEHAGVRQAVPPGRAGQPARGPQEHVRAVRVP